MTALNFPANPSNGDTYENYQYDATDGVWKRLPSSSLGINGLADVTINTPLDGESLVYDNASGEWINADATVEVYGVDTATTSYFSLPKGTDAQRPVSPSNGDIRFNTDRGEAEYYSEAESSWFLFRQRASSVFDIDYLVIAGGGGGGGEAAGGGGAGGYRTNTFSLEPGAYTVTVGAGGAGAITATSGSSGADSVFATISSAGGGGGGSYNAVSAISGGSGGGAGYNAASSPGTGIAGQGNDGGTALLSGSWFSGGGGGAGSAGVNGASPFAGDGGAGLSSSITGSSVTRAGGGGGSTTNTDNFIGLGGSGGGGNGGRRSPALAATNGVNNTGGGGGGGNYAPSVDFGGTGGSGVVIFKMLSSADVSFSAGLTEANGGSGQTIGDYTVYTVTAGTGTVTFA